MGRNGMKEAGIKESRRQRYESLMNMEHTFIKEPCWDLGGGLPGPEINASLRWCNPSI